MKHRSTTHLLMLAGILSLSTPALASESSQMPPPENVSASSTGMSTTSAFPFKALERIPIRTKLTSAELAEYEGKWTRAGYHDHNMITLNGAEDRVTFNYGEIDNIEIALYSNGHP